MHSDLTFGDMFFEKYFQPLKGKKPLLLTSVVFAAFRDIFSEKYFSPTWLHPEAAQGCRVAITGSSFIFNGLQDECEAVSRSSAVLTVLAIQQLAHRSFCNPERSEGSLRSRSSFAEIPFDKRNPPGLRAFSAMQKGQPCPTA
jgi:hypothetical protein